MFAAKDYAYSIRLAMIYCLVWFVDFLDATSLNVTLPAIAQFFQINPAHTEWAIIGFLLSMTIGMSLSGWLGDHCGTRKIFLLSQCLYIFATLECGFAFNFFSLILGRLIQGFAAGMAIPLGMAALMRAMPQTHWAKTTSIMNMVTLFAPALGPIFGTYATSLIGWRWVFFLKLPICFFCLVLSLLWVRKEELPPKRDFDWPGFILGSLSLAGILWMFSEIGKWPHSFLLMVAAGSIFLGVLFILRQNRSRIPLFPLEIFKIRHFAIGNIIQSAANTIFLGANFIIALYLQKGLGLDLVATGWIMAAVTPGMILVQPFIGNLYNRLGPLPFIIPGLSLLSLSMVALVFTDWETSPYLLGFFVFCIGAASGMAQSANVTSIFSCLPHQYKGAGSSLYSLFKQISASFGVAISTMVLSIGMDMNGLSVIGQNSSSIAIFHACFAVLGSIPALALFFCFFIDNKKAVSETKLVDV